MDLPINNIRTVRFTITINKQKLEVICKRTLVDNIFTDDIQVAPYFTNIYPVLAEDIKKEIQDQCADKWSNYHTINK